MNEPQKLKRPTFLQDVERDTLRLTKESRRQLRELALRSGRPIPRNTKTHDEMLKAYVDAMPDRMVEKCLEFMKTPDDPKVDGTN